jgi:hypothetical protein
LTEAPSVADCVSGVGAGTGPGVCASLAANGNAPIASAITRLFQRCSPVLPLLADDLWPAVALVRFVIVNFCPVIVWSLAISKKRRFLFRAWALGRCDERAPCFGYFSRALSRAGDQFRLFRKTQEISIRMGVNSTESDGVNPALVH